MGKGITCFAKSNPGAIGNLMRLTL